MASIAFIGLGNGGPMAANLVKAGHKVIASIWWRPRATGWPTAPPSPKARLRQSKAPTSS
jgi:hypothetical protein